ncbi:MAG: hypothetical protein M3Z16_00075, partial [Pseudomonadota bacterium]|nr:hypothetical protein [Pseudomonadota bacterium]
ASHAILGLMIDRLRLRRAARHLARALDALTAVVAWAVLPLAVLLFAQWPLRDFVGAWSLQANDVAQWLFALYVGFAIRATTARGEHLAASSGLGRKLPPRQSLDRRREALLVLPWALFVVVSGAGSTWRSLLSLEAFPDTFDPLYFLIRGGAWLLALLMSLQAGLALVGIAPASAEDADGSNATPGPT